MDRINDLFWYLAICQESVDIGSCTTGNYKRFYFDPDDKTCRGFIYTGCGGNRNNFKTFESCIATCLKCKWRFGFRYRSQSLIIFSSTFFSLRSWLHSLQIGRIEIVHIGMLILIFFIFSSIFVLSSAVYKIAKPSIPSSIIGVLVQFTLYFYLRNHLFLSFKSFF